MKYSDIGFENLFPYEWKRLDPNKDINGKGTIERFTDAMLDYWDNEQEAIVRNFIPYVKQPTTALDEIFPYIETSLGADFLNIGTLPQRRMIAQHFQRIVALKGTYKALQILFNIFGFNVEIEEFYSDYSFDSPYTWDDTSRRLDMGKCSPCSTYQVTLDRQNGVTGVPLTSEETIIANSILRWNEPINAVLLGINVI